MYFCLLMSPKFKIDLRVFMLAPHWQELHALFSEKRFLRLSTDRDISVVSSLVEDIQWVVPESARDINKLLEIKNHHRVNISVIVPFPFLFYYDLKAEQTAYWAEFYNDFISHLQESHRKRLIGIGTVPLQDVNIAIKELERVVQKLDLKGVVVGTKVGDKPITDKVFFPFWEAVQELAVPVLIQPNLSLHSWKSNEIYQIQKFNEIYFTLLNWLKSEIHQTFPKLKVLFYDGLECISLLVPVLMEKIGNKFIEKLHNFYFSGIIHPNVLKSLMEWVSIENFVYSSDLNSPLPSESYGKLLEETSLFSDAQKEQYFWKTAFSIFSIRPGDFFSFYS